MLGRVNALTELDFQVKLMGCESEVNKHILVTGENMIFRCSGLSLLCSKFGPTLVAGGVGAPSPSSARI